MGFELKISMKSPGTNFFKNSVYVGIGGVIFLLSLSAGVQLYNQYLLTSNKSKSEIIDKIDDYYKQLLGQLNMIDLGLRGYALTQDKQLLNPYNDAKNILFTQQFDSLSYYLQKISYPGLEEVSLLKKEYVDYYAFCDQMITLVNKNQLSEFKQKLKLDKGFYVWQKYDKLTKDIQSYVDHYAVKAKEQYDFAIYSSLILQLILLLLGVPCLVFLLRIIRKDALNRKNLIRKLDENNRHYIFDPGELTDLQNEESVFEQSNHNLQKASQLISMLSQSDYNSQWEGLNEQNRHLNTHNLAGKISELGIFLQSARDENKKRMWINDGLAKMGDILKIEYQNQNDFYAEVLKTLIQYINAVQGSLFILNDASNTQQKLEMAAAYAYDRKKYIKKSFEPGEGLIGQIFLEKQKIYLNRLPENYSTIISGIGQTQPKCLLILPLKVEEEVIGILEIASLGEITTHQQEYLEKASENLAYTILRIQNNSKTRILLEETQFQAEQLRAQEEEMRQNMEELQATQEAMKQKQEELEKNSEKLKANEMILLKVNEQMKKQKEELELKTKKFEHLLKSDS